MKIKFTSVFHDIPKELYPKPASACLPDWYKQNKPYVKKNQLILMEMILFP